MRGVDEQQGRWSEAAHDRERRRGQARMQRTCTMVAEGVKICIVVRVRRIECEGVVVA